MTRNNTIGFERLYGVLIGLVIKFRISRIIFNIISTHLFKYNAISAVTADTASEMRVSMDVTINFELNLPEGVDRQ